MSNWTPRMRASRDGHGMALGTKPRSAVTPAPPPALERRTITVDHVDYEVVWDGSMKSLDRMMTPSVAWRAR